jgi:dihydroxy-acid dehydratase
VLVDGSELERRRAAWSPSTRDERGYRSLYADHVMQANEGCDLDFLRGRSPVVTDAVTYL